MFPWLKPWLKDVARVMKNVGENLKEMRGCIKNLQETLNPQDSRGFVDSFLIYQQNAEVKCHPFLSIINKSSTVIWKVTH